jgi:CelD/BcsL family acetyltransferase involved in cellulose biosynthesis
MDEARSINDLEQLRADWQQLYAACDEATPFQSPAWLISWCKHLCNSQLLVLTAREGDRLIGLLPFCLDTRVPGKRELRLLGTGVSDYLDLLVIPEWRESFCAAAWQHLERIQDQWDSCDWQQLRPTSPLLMPVPAGWECETVQGEPCLQLPPLSGGGLSNVIPKTMCRKLRYYRHRLEKLGNAVFERATCETFSDVFDSFLQLHQNRWRAKGQGGLLNHKALREFHREAALGFLEHGSLRLCRLRLGPEPIASLYGFKCGDRLFCYLTGFDPNYQQLSPGTLMLGYAIESAMAEGARQFDFLRGSEPYKFYWGARAKPAWRRIIRRS